MQDLLYSTVCLLQGALCRPCYWYHACGEHQYRAPCMSQQEEGLESEGLQLSDDYQAPHHQWQAWPGVQHHRFWKSWSEATWVNHNLGSHQGHARVHDEPQGGLHQAEKGAAASVGQAYTFKFCERAEYAANPNICLSTWLWIILWPIYCCPTTNKYMKEWWPYIHLVF